MAFWWHWNHCPHRYPALDLGGKEEVGRSWKLYKQPPHSLLAQEGAVREKKFPCCGVLSLLTPLLGHARNWCPPAPPLPCPVHGPVGLS